MGGLVIVLGSLLVMAMQARSARDDLQKARSEIAVVQDAISDGDTASARQSLTVIQDRARSARSTFSQPQWAVAARVPWIGGDVEAVRTVTTAIDDVGQDVLPTLVGLTSDLDSGAFAPAGGVFDFSALRAAAGSLEQADAAFQAAAEPVQKIEPDDLTGLLSEPVTEAQALLGRFSSALSRAAVVADILPDMTEGDRDYLLVFQNNAELRAQGGLPGAWAQIKLRDGKVSVGRQEAGGKTVADAPVEDLLPSDIQAFRTDLATDFRDAAFTPDTPTASRLQSKLVEAVWGVRTDGVIALDPVTLSYLLAAVGPIKISDRLTLTSDNAVEILLSRIYALQTDPDKQDAFFALVTREMFERIADGRFDTPALVKGLVRGGEEGRIHVWSKEPDVQSRLDRTTVGGALPTGTASPAIGVYLNDLTGAKMNYYLTFSSLPRAVRCTAEGVQSYELKLLIRSTAPDPATLPSYVLGEGDPPGSQLISLDVLGLTGGPRPVFTMGKNELTSESYQVQGRPGSQLAVQLDPGDAAVLTVTITSPPGQFGPTRYAQTPTITSGVIPSTIPSACL